MNIWVNESCPLIIEDKKDINEKNNIINNSETFKINSSEYENQNLTTEDEYITNQFMYINKRIDKIKNKLGMNIDKTIKQKRETKKITFEFELSPIFILFWFIVFLIVTYAYTSIKKIFLDKSHIK